MTRWLLNSAVIPAGGYGLYQFSPATAGELADFLADGDYQSRIGYVQTAQMIAAWTGLPAPPLSREDSQLTSGDVAFIVRLRYRVDPTRKGAPISENPEDWEIGRLTRIR
jgi:hypothetical protein